MGQLMAGFLFQGCNVLDGWVIDGPGMVPRLLPTIVTERQLIYDHTGLLPRRDTTVIVSVEAAVVVG